MANNKKKNTKTICPRCDGSGFLQEKINYSVTPGQMAVFVNFKKFNDEKGHAPSVRILAAMEMSSVTATYNKLCALVDKGILGRFHNDGKKHTWNNWYIKRDIAKR